MGLAEKWEDTCLDALRLQDAHLSNHVRSLVFVSACGNLAVLEIARQIRGYFGPPGGAGKKIARLVDNGKSNVSPSTGQENHDSCLAGWERAEKKSDGATQLGR